MVKASREIEAKFQVADPADWRRRLKDLHAVYQGRVAEANWMCDTAERRLLQGGAGLRVRHAWPLEPPAQEHFRLTYKGPREAARVKTREELETSIDDAAHMLRLLERIGMSVTLRYEKRRETWRLDGCEITLDELPDGTWWSEVEGPEDCIQKVADRLGVRIEDAIDEGYVEHAARFGRRDGDDVISLLFSG